MRSRPLHAGYGVLIGALFAGGCGESLPSSPTSLAVQVSVSITGPASLVPGATGQFEATVLRSDGTTTDVTHQAQWSTSRSDVLAFGAGGLGTAGLMGETQVRATYGALSSPLTVTVLEPGTFKLIGRLRDRATGGPIVFGQVEIVEGTRAGLSLFTDADGRFAFFGLSGPTLLRASRPLFVSREVALDVSSATEPIDVELDPILPAADLTGDWRLNLSGGPDCGGLPAGARPGELALRIRQNGIHLTAEVGTPMLWSAFPLGGLVLDREVNLVFASGEDELDAGVYFSVLLRVPPVGLLGLAGTFKAQIPSDVDFLAGEFAGALHYFASGVVTGAGTVCSGRWSAVLEPDRR